MSTAAMQSHLTHDLYHSLADKNDLFLCLERLQIFIGIELGVDSVDQFWEFVSMFSTAFCMAKVQAEGEEIAPNIILSIWKT